MMLLDRYVGRTVLAGIVFVLVVIVGLDLVFSFVAELEDLEASYQSMDALWYVLMTAPRRCYEFLPIATLIGCLVTLGNMANNSELVVMRAAGWSVLRIARAALLPAFLVAVFGLVLGQFVVPKTEQYAQSERAIKQGSSAIRAKHGHWHREGSDYIHITAIQPSGVLFGVTRYRFDEEGRLYAASHARRANHTGDHWELQQLQASRLGVSEVRVSSEERRRWDSAITPELLSILSLRPDDLSITGLYSYASYLAAQGLNARKYFLAFFRKVMQPAATLVMALLAMTFVFGPLRSVTVGLRIMAGVITGLIFQYLQDFAGHASLVFQLPSLLASLLPIVICGALGALLMKRAR